MSKLRQAVEKMSKTDSQIIIDYLLGDIVLNNNIDKVGRKLEKLSQGKITKQSFREWIFTFNVNKSVQ